MWHTNLTKILTVVVHNWQALTQLRNSEQGGVLERNSWEEKLVRKSSALMFNEWPIVSFVYLETHFIVWIVSFNGYDSRWQSADRNWRSVLIHLVLYCSTANIRTVRSIITRYTGLARCWANKSTPQTFGYGTLLALDLPVRPSRKSSRLRKEVPSLVTRWT